MKLPLYTRKDSKERGRHLVASCPLQRNQLIFVERPLVSLQSLDNVHSNLVCGHCRTWCGNESTQWGLASRRLSRQDVVSRDSSIIPCRHDCGQVYCSTECEQDDWTAGHALLCTGRIENDSHALVQFKIHAIQHNEVFLMVADAVVGMLLNKDVKEKMLDFCREAWWQVATAPLVASSSGQAEAKVLDTTLRRLCQESSALFKEALSLMLQQQQQDDNDAINVTQEDIDELCSAESFARIIGSFEQNAIGIRQRHPLCRQVFERNVRAEYKADLIHCLKHAGMIDGTEKNDGDDDEPDGNVTTQDEIDDNEYTNDEIAQFLAGLDLDEQTESNDLDELFSTLDGTAMYATACKMNHSCSPNVVVLYKPSHYHDEMMVPLMAHCVALRDIDEGEELCISYIDQNASLEERQEALANYGFQCQCEKCLREKAGEEECGASMEQDELDEDGLFGPDEDESDCEEGEDETDDLHPIDGEKLLQTRRNELDKEMNESATNTIPVHALAVACNYVIRVGSAAADVLPNELQGLALTQQCLEAVRARDFVQCCKVGSLLEQRLYNILQQNKSWPDTAHRQAYGAGVLACSIGNLHVGNLLKAQSMLDKAFILGLPRNEIEVFFGLVEHFANQAASPPHGLAVGCRVDNEIDIEDDLEPLEFPMSEASPDITTGEFEMQYVSQAKAVVFRGFASEWVATSRWRDLTQLVRANGHRLVPIELGTMMKHDGMKEEIMAFRSFVGSFLVWSSKKKLWTLSDATDVSSTVAYLAQHPLFDQIPALCQDIVMNPRLCSSPPSHRNVWMGTGGTRTPLHFDSYDNLLVQLVGYKYVRVYDTSETDNLYVIRGGNKGGLYAQGNMSALNCELEDFEEHPLARNADYQEVYLGPGDCLFLPARMWHYVRSLSTSISVNYWW